MTRDEALAALRAEINALATATRVGARTEHRAAALALVDALATVTPPATAEEAERQGYEQGVFWALNAMKDANYACATSLQRVLDRGGEPVAAELSSAANGMRNYAGRILGLVDSAANRHLRERLRK